jgi:putative ATP-dependent endonuclease of OLD family
LGLKLTRIEIKSYRSVPGAIKLDLGTGANVLVGPNNVGKSNLMRALGLVFGEGADAFDLERDAPAMALWARPTVTLDFTVSSPVRGFEKTLLRYAKDAEEAVLAERPSSTASPYASGDRIRLRVKYTKTEGRSDYIVTRGAGDQRAPAHLNDKAVDQLLRSLRFVLIKSGEDVDAFLRGRFSEVLANVLEENLAAKLQEAREAREGYMKHLEGTLFSSLGEEVFRELRELVPELTSVHLRPKVPSIEDTISAADVILKDVISTDLEGKGTGLRGGLLVAMLKYLADQSRRSLVLAVEEPETFLHPGSQELIRDDLESVAQRSDVTLLVTTHSPFIIPRHPATTIVALRKSREGETQADATARGDEPRVDAIAGLFPSRAFASAIEEVARAELSPDCRTISSSRVRPTGVSSRQRLPSKVATTSSRESTSIPPKAPTPPPKTQFCGGRRGYRTSWSCSTTMRMDVPPATGS